MAYDVRSVTDHIRRAAAARGIDPETAVRVARSEGLANGVWQSNLSKGGRREPSYGPFQLLVGGNGTAYPAGMGNDFIRDTGLDPSDPSNVEATVDYALDRAARDGWGAWYGAAKVGVGKRDGIGGKPTGPRPEVMMASSGGSGTLRGEAGEDRLTGKSGGLGGLGGMAMPNFEPERVGWRDVLGAVGDSLMTAPADEWWSDAGAHLQAREKELKGKNLENKTLAYAEANFPEVAQMMRAGMSGSDAFTLMAQMSRGEAPEMTADQRNFAMAQQDPEFAKFIGIGKEGFRPATAEEAAAYGATAGQIGPDKRFYPIDAPTGMTVESDGKGGFRFTQGSGSKGGAFTEGQSKDNVYSTRARGALPTLDTYADALDSYGQRLMDADPTGIVRGRYQDSDYQVAKTAGDEFLQAILRKDTGAAITQQEQEMYGRTYLPQPGDSREVKAYKAKARQRAIAAVEAGMSPSQMVAQERALEASGGNEPMVPGSDGGAKRRKFNPATGTIE